MTTHVSTTPAGRLLQHVYAGLPSDAWCEFVALLPPERRAPGLRSPVVLSCRLDGWPALSALLRLNQQGYGIHYGLTAKATRPPRWRRSSESDARWLAVLWADLDVGEGLTRQQAFRALQEFSPCPTAVIDSGGGYQVLWRIEPTEITDTNRQHLRNILRGLALALSGDVACAELSRLFRLPGTLNTKPKRHWAECRLLDVLPWVHPLSAFERYAELGAPPPAPPLPPSLPDGARLALPGWVQRYLTEGRPEGRRNRTLYGAAIEYKVRGYSQAEAEGDLLPRALADGLDEREARRTIASAYRSTTGDLRVPEHIRARLVQRKKT